MYMVHRETYRQNIHAHKIKIRGKGNYKEYILEDKGIDHLPSLWSFVFF